VRLKKAKPFSVSEPVTLEMEFTRPIYAEAVSMIPLSKREDSRRVVMEVPDYRSAYNGFRAAINLAATVAH